MRNYTMSPVDPAIQWLPVPGTNNRYEVSNTGLVRRGEENRAYPRHSLLSTRSDQYGYTLVILNEIGKQRTRYLHRVVMRAFVGECPPGMEVNHINGVKNDNNLSNLEYVTHAHNIRHAVHVLKAPLGQKGATHNLAKLDDEKIREIRKIASVGISTGRIAELYGVSQPLISGILNGRYWSHVKDEA